MKKTEKILKTMHSAAGAIVQLAAVGAGMVWTTGWLVKFFQDLE